MFPCATAGEHSAALDGARPQMLALGGRLGRAVGRHRSTAAPAWRMAKSGSDDDEDGEAMEEEAQDSSVGPAEAEAIAKRVRQLNSKKLTEVQRLAEKLGESKSGDKNDIIKVRVLLVLLLMVLMVLLLLQPLFLLLPLLQLPLQLLLLTTTTMTIQRVVTAEAGRGDFTPPAKQKQPPPAWDTAQLPVLQRTVTAAGMSESVLSGLTRPSQGGHPSDKTEPEAVSSLLNPHSSREREISGSVIAQLAQSLRHWCLLMLAAAAADDVALSKDWILTLRREFLPNTLAVIEDDALLGSPLPTSTAAAGGGSGGGGGGSGLSSPRPEVSWPAPPEPDALWAAAKRWYDAEGPFKGVYAMAKLKGAAAKRKCVFRNSAEEWTIHLPFNCWLPRVTPTAAHRLTRVTSSPTSGACSATRRRSGPYATTPRPPPPRTSCVFASASALRRWRWSVSSAASAPPKRRTRGRGPPRLLRCPRRRCRCWRN